MIRIFINENKNTVVLLYGDGTAEVLDEIPPTNKIGVVSDPSIPPDTIVVVPKNPRFKKFTGKGTRGNPKLTDEQRDEIRQRMAKGEKGKALAA